MESPARRWESISWILTIEGLAYKGPTLRGPLGNLSLRGGTGFQMGKSYKLVIDPPLFLIEVHAILGSPFADPENFGDSPH